MNRQAGLVSRRIFVVTLVPRIASENPVAPFEGATDRPVFLYGFNEVGAASWLESTVATQHRTDGFLIKPDHQNQDKPRNGNNELKKRFHVSSNQWLKCFRFVATDDRGAF